MTSGSGRRVRGDRPLEVLAVLLLGAATLGSAWCGYQASRWNSEENELTTRSSDERIESSRLFGLATQQVSYDSMVVAQYAAAVASGNADLVAFYRDTLVRPAFRPVLDRWQAEIQAGEQVGSLLEDEAYIEGQLGEYRAAEGRAEVAAEEARDAGENSDDFVLLTVLFASALFLAGLTTSFRGRFARVFLILSAGLVLAYCGARLVDLPVA
jgi:hypothetical protein